MKLQHKFSIGLIECSAPLIALIILTPLVAVAFSLFSGESFAVLKHLSETVLSDYVINSVLLVLGVSFVTLVIGVPTAWLTSVFDFPGCKIFVWALLLPLAFPAYIIAYTYTGVLDYAGPVYSALREFVGRELADQLYFSIRSVPGAILMLGLVLYPYVYLLARAAFLEQSASYIEISRSLGYSLRRVFFRLAVPLARPSIITGLSLALMETLADYGTVQFFGVSTFTTGIFRAFYGFGDPAAAAQLSSMLLLFVVLLIFTERYSRRTIRYHAAGGKRGFEVNIRLHGKRAVLSWLFCALPVFFGFLLPALILLKWSLFDAQWNWARFLQLIWNTFYLAFLAALIAVFFAVILGYAKRASRSKLIHGFISISGMGYAIPGAIVAVGVIVPLVWIDHQMIRLFAAVFDMDVGLILSGSVVALLFAYTVRFLAISLNTVDSGLGKIKPNMDNAARCLGYRAPEILRKIHLPLMKASLLTAFLIVFVDTLKELPATLMLRPFDFNTLAVRAFELASDERLVDAALPSLMIIATGIIPIILLSKTISQEIQVSD